MQIFSEKIEIRQEKIQNNRIQERDKTFMQSMNEFMETKRQIASSETEKKKGFFKN